MITIWLIKSESAKCWMSHTNDPRVKELFGTDRIPTAFTLDASPDFVLAQVQRLNPNADVKLA